MPSAVPIQMSDNTSKLLISKKTSQLDLKFCLTIDKCKILTINEINYCKNTTKHLLVALNYLSLQRCFTTLNNTLVVITHE